MFERFTDRARRVIVLAQEEARALQHNYIGTEHLLLGLIREGEGVAAKALASKGVELDATRKQVEEMIGKGNAAPNGHIPFTPHAKQVLEFSLREALQLGHSYIGTEHILLGLIREGEGVGTQVLIKMDVDLGELRSATIDMIRGNSGTGTGDGKGDLANAGGVTDKQNKSGSAILDQFGRNLTAEAAEGKLDPVIGRTNEIERVMVVLSRRTKNNPVLIGEPGVGKTAVVEGLAQKIQAGDVPETLKGKQVYSLDLGSMVAGSRYRGDFEERLKKVLKEIKTRGDIVLFIDEIHTIVGAGSADGALGASDMLKPMLARGELQTIGATTTDEYRKYIEKDAALERRFQPIQVHEPTIAETIEILKGLRSRYENHHHVTITDGALQSAAELSSRYIQDRNLPDKAIDLIDEAGARLRIKRLTAPPELKELDEKIAKIAADKDEAIKGQDFEKAAELRDNQEKLEAERKAKEDAFWATVEVGKHYMGTVKNLATYGAFVDLGGVDGMVHNTELSWKRIKHPSQVVKVGDVIDVYVKDFNRETGKISLGYKTDEMNSWYVFKNKYNVGDVATVKIVSFTPFGAFAEIVPGTDGLIHISQISKTRIAQPSDVLEIGEEVEVKIIDIDEEKQKVSLSIRALIEDAEAAAAAEDAEKVEAVAETDETPADAE